MLRNVFGVASTACFGILLGLQLGGKTLFENTDSTFNTSLRISGVGCGCLFVGGTVVGFAISPVNFLPTAAWETRGCRHFYLELGVPYPLPHGIVERSIVEGGR